VDGRERGSVGVRRERREGEREREGKKTEVTESRREGDREREGGREGGKEGGRERGGRREVGGWRGDLRRCCGRFAMD